MQLAIAIALFLLKTLIDKKRLMYSITGNMKTMIYDISDKENFEPLL